MNHESNPFWVAESLINPNTECFLFRRSGTEIRVTLRGLLVEGFSRELSKEEIWFIEKYYTNNE